MKNLRSRSDLHDIGESWAAGLPDTIVELSARWGLTLTGEQLTGGCWGLVLGVTTTDGQEAVLKLCADTDRLEAETSALKVWGGGPAVNVLADEPGALLLERVRPGTPCADLGPDQLAALLSQLGQPAGTGLKDWQAEVEYLRLRLPELAEAIAMPEIGGVVQKLADRILEEAEGSVMVTLHGDLQAAHILDRLGTPVVIDPFGIAGPAEMDVANCALNNHWDDKDLDARITELAELTGMNAELTLVFGKLNALRSALHHLNMQTSLVQFAPELLRFACN